VADSSPVTKKFQKEMNAGIASLVLLSVLEKSSEPMYGYQIAKLLEEYSRDASFMKQGALYPVLRSLENSGLLDSKVEPSVSGPPRIYYGITPEGRETLVTWGALLFMLIAFVTGIVYFTWAVTGLSLSVSLAIFIFGLPFAILFLLSIRGLALLEGRIVEALLGVRMPRRTKFSHQEMKWLERLKLLVTDKYNWKMLVYMLFQLILGTLYFSIFIILLSVSLSLMIAPVFESITDLGAPGLIIGNVRFYLSAEWHPLMMILGFLLLTASMHLFKLIGQFHGKYSKMFLVTD
jgi:DNA-binding PadR family transcriptional regulator